MTAEESPLEGPDLAQGVPLSEIADGGMLAGHGGGKPVLLVRRGDEIFAVSAICRHYGGPLAEGIVVGETVRCPWHHACFSLRTGEALRAPALNPIACWTVEQRDGRVHVGREIGAPDGATPLPGVVSSPRSPTIRSIVIVGAGAAGNAAAEMLRRDGYSGAITIIGADDAVPCDRPNLSKDYLAGTVPEEWIPLHPRAFYGEHRIELVSGTRVTDIDVTGRRVMLDGERGPRSFDRLLIATGADPIRLPLPGVDMPHVHYLRTLADSRSIIATAKRARRAVVMGASFIGLEVAASLRARDLEVHVIAPEAQPLEKVLGPELGAFIRSLHERHGVIFHLRQLASSIGADSVTLESGDVIAADLVVIGAGVRPALDLAERAGLAIDRGVTVDEYLETSAPGIFAAGDIARYPDAYSGERIRVEHWVVAERQGQVAARNMLGRRDPFTAVPFFWSAHYDTTVSYVGHAEAWDDIAVAGDVEHGDCTVAFRARGKTLALATVGRDRVSLEAEAAMERRDVRALEALMAR